MPIEILMPALSPTMTEGNLAKWTKKEGDKVEPGEVIAEIETDKATMEVESIDEGVIGKIIIQEGTQNVAVNTCIALLLTEGEKKDVLKNYKIKAETEEAPVEEVAEIPKKAGKKTPTPAQAAAAPAVGLTPPPIPVFPEDAGTSNAPKQRVQASPLAKRLASEAGIDIAALVGSGPRGRVVQEDVEQAIRAGGMGGGRVQRAPSLFNKVANDNMRKTIATRLLQSKQHVPHFYLSMDVELDALLALRKDLNEEGVTRGVEGQPAYKLSVNDMVIKAAARALKKVPEANASWTDEATFVYNNVDISVAVAVEGGLVTPVVQNADQKSLPAISNEMKDLATRARAGKLTPEEYQGGGFSISNLGMFGVNQFNAIINPPQSCILAVGAGVAKPVVKNGQLVPATVMTLTLSCDHRVVDGAVGAELLGAIRTYLEKPIKLIV